MRKTVIALIILVLLLVAWMLSGLFGGTDEDSGSSIAGEAPSKSLQEVVVREIEAEDYYQRVRLHGVTQANRRVALAARTHGVVLTTPIEEGEAVREGDLLVSLDLEEREEVLQRAKDEVALREIQLKAALRLQKESLSSEVTVAEAEANLSAAREALRLAELAVAFCEIRAPFDGFLEKRWVEEGSSLVSGDPVADIVELNPLSILGHATEKERMVLKRGEPVKVELRGFSGERQATLDRVSVEANEATRTFEVEAIMENQNAGIPAGITATMEIETVLRRGHPLQVSQLYRNDEGVFGLKAVDSGDRVVFHSVEILGNEGETVWLGGLPDRLRLIVRGQGFVKVGQEVRPVEEDKE